MPASDGRMKGLVSGMNGRAPSGSYGSVRFSLLVSKPARAEDTGHPWLVCDAVLPRASQLLCGLASTTNNSTGPIVLHACEIGRC